MTLQSLRNILTHLLLSLTCLFVLCVATAQAGEGKAEEGAVKAALLYNLAKFIEWPESAFVDDASPVNVCVLGPISFSGDLLLLQGKSIKNRPIMVFKTDRLENVKGCNILVVSETYEDLLPQINAMVKKGSMISISEADGFAEEGGMIELFLQGGKVKFRVNHASMKEAQLIISSQVLKLAVEVF